MFDCMHARSRENRAAHFQFGMISRWWQALGDREPWLLSLQPRAGVTAGHQPPGRVNWVSWGRVVNPECVSFYPLLEAQASCL